MDPSIIDLVKKTVPERLHEQVNKIFVSSETYEDRRARSGYGSFKRKGNYSHDEGYEATRDPKSVQSRIGPLAIACVIMELWSPKMYSRAENLILKKAVQMKYIEDKHLRYVHVFQGIKSYREENFKLQDDWVVEDQDEVVVNVVWNILNIKKIYDEIRVHRSLIQKTYDRIKEFVQKELHPEIIERHDLTKFAFNQAIGYTLKFVHGIYHPIWTSACDLHLQNEPHHPQVWRCEFPQTLKEWAGPAYDFKDDCVYGINLAPLNFEHKSMPPLAFLLESYIDMVAVEWERKKQQNPDITNSEMIGMDIRYMERYKGEQTNILQHLVNQVIAGDKSWDTFSLTERERRLFSMVPHSIRGLVIHRMNTFKGYRKYELDYQKRLKSERAPKSPEEYNTIILNYGFLIAVSNIILDFWDSKFRKSIEQLVLKRAVKEGYIEESHMKWIFFFEKGQEEKKHFFPYPEPFIYPGDIEDIVTLIWEEFNMREHFKQLKYHRYWVKQIYQRFKKFLPELPEEVIERHDLSKCAFSIAVGYTQKYVHDTILSTSHKAMELHEYAEPHHPKFWLRYSSTNEKMASLENYLSVQTGNDNYGIELSKLDITSERMNLVFLLESFVDLLSAEFEGKNIHRKLEKMHFNYLQYGKMHKDQYIVANYVNEDKAFLEKLLKKVQEANEPESIEIKDADKPESGEIQDADKSESGEIQDADKPESGEIQDTDKPQSSEIQAVDMPELVDPT